MARNQFGQLRPNVVADVRAIGFAARNGKPDTGSGRLPWPNSPLARHVVHSWPPVQVFEVARGLNCAPGL